MGQKYIPEHHVMEWYFGLDTVTYGLFEAIRDGTLNGGIPRFKEGILRAAKQEIAGEMSRLDKSAYPFRRDMGHLVIGGQPKRMIGLIEGHFVYEDGQTLESKLGVDLGTNPWPVFQDGNLNETIDSMATSYAVRQFFAAHREELEGVRRFRVAKSHFLYLDDKAAARLPRDERGEIDMLTLVPLIKYTRYVGFKPANVPSQAEYSEILPVPFTIDRLKASLTGKSVENLSLPRISSDDVIRDWAGHRAVVENEEKARELAQSLSNSPTIGSSGTSRIECAEYEDGYRSPESSGFKALKITARVTVMVKGRPITTIRRIHILDRDEYYQSEVRAKGRASRPAFERIRERKRRNQSLVKLLDELFPRSTGFVEVPSELVI